MKNCLIGTPMEAEICREWLIPKTTLSSLVKRWEKDGLLVQEPSPEDKRERTLRLTEEGLAFAGKYLQRIYLAEDLAMQNTLAKFGPDFIEAMEFYSCELEKGFTGKESSDL